MLSLDQIDPSDYQKVGPKAASLARLRHRCGLQVPEAVVIDNHWLHLFLDSAGLSSKVELLKQILWTIRQEHLEKVSSEVVSGLRSTTLPDELERSLLSSRECPGSRAARLPFVQQLGGFEALSVSRCVPLGSGHIGFA